jgi:hypothetical protein
MASDVLGVVTLSRQTSERGAALPSLRSVMSCLEGYNANVICVMTKYAWFKPHNVLEKK